MTGLYIHIPFCKSKCPYCDFYSYCGNEKETEAYTKALVEEIHTRKRTQNYLTEPMKCDTLYLGGGTPSVLSGEQLYRIITAAKSAFTFTEDAEITVECNPSSDIEGLLPYFLNAGVNRISLGMQSAVDTERKALGRISDKNRIRRVVKLLKDAGISNISIDIMLGIPHQTSETLRETVDFVTELHIPHISAYILKIEENTFFGKNRHRYTFPDDDTAADLYLQCSELLREAGFSHYEVSNFALAGFESRHNTKYWLLEDYLGLGPGAHSCIGNKRFFFDSSTEDFINGEKPVYDCEGGGKEEYIMLRLRLKEGLSISTLREKYGEDAALSILKKQQMLCSKDLATFDGDRFALTEKGFLLSNSIIADIIY